jgi:ribosomal protein L11 methyltransferase
MNWLQISLEVDEGGVADVCDAFAAAGAISVTLRDAADQPVYEPAPGDTPLWSRTRVVALFPDTRDSDSLRTRLAGTLGNRVAALHFETLEDRDWERVWMDDFGPMRFGRRLWVCPGQSSPAANDAVAVALDPGLAFGTGTHATTALCLEWLDAHPPAGRCVIDYGCGSGILAIAALRLGADRAWAVDIDPQALQATAENARRNGVEGRLALSAPEELSAVTADVALANILANPLIELADRLAQRVRAGGWIVLSGVLGEQANTVAAAYRSWFELDEPVFRDGWVRLEGRRR